jgi:hypothetical protein
VQDARERGAAVGDVAARDERVGDVRAADGAAVDRLLEHVVPRERVVLGDPLDDPLGAVQAAVTNACRLADDVVVQRVEEVGEHVHARRPVVGAQLHAGNHEEAGAGCRGLRLIPARRRVVVGERDRAEPRGDRSLHQLAGRLGAVGHAAVRVQVDESG